MPTRPFRYSRVMCRSERAVNVTSMCSRHILQVLAHHVLKTSGNVLSPRQQSSLLFPGISRIMNNPGMDLPLYEVQRHDRVRPTELLRRYYTRAHGFRIKRECRRWTKFVPSKLNVQPYTSKIRWRVAKTKRTERPFLV